MALAATAEVVLLIIKDVASLNAAPPEPAKVIVSPTVVPEPIAFMLTVMPVVAATDVIVVTIPVVKVVAFENITEFAPATNVTAFVVAADTVNVLLELAAAYGVAAVDPIVIPPAPPVSVGVPDI